MAEPATATSVPWSLLLQSAAVLNAVLLAAVLALNPRLRRTRGRFQLGAVLIAFATALALFTAMDSGWIAVSRWAVGVEYACALYAGALLVDFTASAVRAESPIKPLPLRAVYALPTLCLPWLFGGWVLTETALVAVISAQLALSTLATMLYVRAAGPRPRHLAALLIGVWALHAMQLLRMAMPSVPWLFDAVPLIAALLMIALTVLVNSDSRNLKAMLTHPAPPTSGPDLAAIRAQLQRDDAYTDREYSLQHLADALGLSPRRLSALLTQHGSSFYELLHAQRVAAAQKLLADPQEQRTSIEAIGLMVGYRSRSTFYDAFGKATGQSPAEYRRASRSA